MKIWKLNIKLFLSIGICLLSICSSYAQEKESTEIHKTRSSATINGQRYYLHTVEKGQTLFAIAKFYKRDVNDIVIDNPEAIDGIKPGQILKIQIEKKKATQLSASDTASFITHKVEKSQTLYSISKHYGVSVEKIKALNPELSEGLKANQLLKIPSLIKKTEIIATNNTTQTPVTNSTNTQQTSTTSTTNTSSTSTEAADRNSLGYNNYQGEKKEEYNVAFFLPFHADEANAIDLEKVIKGDAQLPNKTTIALQFYEGALLAIDSLKKQQLNAKIFVYDIDDKDSLAIVTILKKPELASMDLIIGPLYGSGFIPVANFAKEHSIAIVSPFTQVNKILFNNPYVSKVSPSITMQVEQMAHFVVDSFKTQNIVVVNNSNPKEVSFLNAFKNAANADLLKVGIADTVRIGFGLGNTQSMLSATKVNVIVLPSNNQSYVTEFITSLNTLKDKYKIVLFGLQNWVNYDNLDFEYLNNLSLHIPSNTFVDYKNSATQNFIKNYRSKYKTEPEVYVFQGFDVTYSFVSILQKEGTGFLKSLSENKFQGIASNFQFSQFPADSGFENKYVYILKYKEYQLLKAN